MEPNVITALAKVQAELGGIAKTRPADGQLNYAYRGIDAISSQVQPLFGREGIVIVPSEAKIMNVEQVVINGKPWTDTFISVEWTVYGPGGLDDHVTAITQGIGRDNSDKGVPKGMTQAFKNLLLRLLCIGDPADDADRPEHQNNATDAQAHVDPERSEAIAVFETVKALDGPGKASLQAWANEQSHKVSVPSMTADAILRAAVADKVRELTLTPSEPVQGELVTT